MCDWLGGVTTSLRGESGRKTQFRLIGSSLMPGHAFLTESISFSEDPGVFSQNE